jgi:hypothetical protein
MALAAAPEIFAVIITVNLSGTSIGAGFRAIRPKVTFRDLSRSIDSWGARERFIAPRRNPSERTQTEGASNTVTICRTSLFRQIFYRQQGQAP